MAYHVAQTLSVEVGASANHCVINKNVKMVPTAAMSCWSKGNALVQNRGNTMPCTGLLDKGRVRAFDYIIMHIIKQDWV